jgi:hypothetical protein
VAAVIGLRVLSMVSLTLTFAACSVTEQTPEEVGQKFQEGIKGKGKIVPIEQEGSQTGPGNSP